VEKWYNALTFVLGIKVFNELREQKGQTQFCRGCLYKMQNITKTV
jgi:hypothetical protein